MTGKKPNNKALVQLTSDDKPEIFAEKVKHLMENIVGKTDVLLFAHADWCPHCRFMTPEWNKAIARVADIPQKHLSIIDIKDNCMHKIMKDYPKELLTEILRKSVRGYPTIAFIRIDKVKEGPRCSIHTFMDERTAPLLEKFIRKNARGK